MSTSSTTRRNGSSSASSARTISTSRSSSTKASVWSAAAALTSRSVAASGSRSSSGRRRRLRLMWVLRRIVSSHARGCRPSNPSMPAVGAHQGVLDEVFGFGVVAGERVGDTQQHLDLGEHVPFERGVVDRWLRHLSGTLCTVVAFPGRICQLMGVLFVVSMRRLIEHLRYRRYLDAHVDGELDPGLARVADHVARLPDVPPRSPCQRRRQAAPDTAVPPDAPPPADASGGWLTSLRRAPTHVVKQSSAVRCRVDGRARSGLGRGR